MNANKLLRVCLVRVTIGLVCVASFSAYGQTLDARSNTKVNNAKAKAWTKSSKDVKDPALDKQVVNIGSRRNNTCNLNIGTAADDGKKRDIVVTTKEVINVCK